MKDIKFKTSLFGGFNKKDVIDNIEALADQISQSENELKSRTSQFLEEKQIFISKIAEYEKRISSLEIALSESERKRAADTESISMLQNDNQRLSQTLKEKENKIAEHKSTLDALNEEVSNLRQQLKEKDEELQKATTSLSSKSDTVSEDQFNRDTPANIGNIIMSVYSNCENIIEDAKKESSRIISDTINKVKEVESQFSEYKNNFVNTKQQISKYIEALEENLDKIDESLYVTQHQISSSTRNEEKLSKYFSERFPNTESIVKKYFSLPK